jgi:hypothetical protein
MGQLIGKTESSPPKSNVNKAKQRQQGKVTSTSKQSNINIKAKCLTKSIDPGVVFG